MTDTTREDWDAICMAGYRTDFDLFQKTWQSATIKANRQHAESETEAWLIEWGFGAERRKRFFAHNAIGDYREVYKDATVHELVRRLPLPPTGTRGDA